VIDINKIAKKIISSTAEQEVERLLKEFLPSTRFNGHVWAVGGYVISFDNI